MLLHRRTLHIVYSLAWCGFFYTVSLKLTAAVQVLLEMTKQGEIGADLGDKIVPLVSGTESDKHTGLMYFFTQQELQQLLEHERLTDLSLMARTLQN